MNKGEVVFEDGCWHITNSISESQLYCYTDNMKIVIGNVFENKV